MSDKTTNDSWNDTGLGWWCLLYKVKAKVGRVKGSDSVYSKCFVIESYITSYDNYQVSSVLEDSF